MTDKPDSPISSPPRLDFIRRCRTSGFSIPEIRSLMKLYRGFKVPSKPKMAALKRSIELIREQMARLGQIERVLIYRMQNPSGELNELLCQLNL